VGEFVFGNNNNLNVITNKIKRHKTNLQTTFKITFRDGTVVREIDVCALVPMLFEHFENNLT
jgi:hypothetical protein